MNRLRALNGPPEDSFSRPGSRWLDAAVVALLAAITAILWYSADVMLALGAVLLLAGLAWFVATAPERATLIVLAGLYLNLGAIAVRYYGLPPLLGGAFVLLLLVPLFRYAVLEKDGLVADHILKVMVLGYLPLLVISAAASGHPEHSLERISTFLIEGLVLYFLIVNAVRSVPLLRRAIWVLLLAAATMGSLSVYQELTGAYASSLGGLAQMEEKEIGTGESTSKGRSVTRPRMAGPVGEANRYAQVLAVVLPLGLLRLQGERTRRLRLLAGFCCLAILGGILLTFSRGAAVALAILIVAMACYGHIRLRHLLGLSAACILMVVLVAPEYAHRISTMVGLSSSNLRTADSAIRGRFTENVASLRIFLEHPLLGVGPGQTSLYTARYGNDLGLKRLEGRRRGHSMYLEELADTGILGLALFLWMPIWILRQLARVRRRWLHLDPAYANLATSFLLAVFTYLATAMFLHLSYQRYYWLLLALAGAAAHVLRCQLPAVAASERVAIRYAAAADLAPGSAARGMRLQ